EPEKGVDVAIAAVAACARPLTLVVAGREGSATDELVAAAAATPPEVEIRLVGAVEAVAELLAAADVCLLASRREGLPGVLVEALAVTTPVVAVDIPGVREVLGDDLGVVVPPGDPAAVAAGIVSVLEGRSGWDPVVARRRFEEHFTLERVAGRTLDAYERALTGPPLKDAIGRPTRRR
ncbi:MAG: glycosyltransferase, partial [Actinomyces sp.]